MAILPTLRNLLIPNKTKLSPQGYKDDMQQLEIWARQPIQQLIAGSGVTLSPSSGLATDAKGNGPFPITISSSGGGGGITSISAGTSNVHISSPSGPIVTISVDDPPYASLTGAGQGSTPGLLDQAGPFSVIDPSGGGHTAIGNAIELIDNTSAGYGIQISSANGQVTIGGDLGASIGATSSGECIVANSGNELGFYGLTGAPAGRQSVTGSRGGNAALASLLTILNNIGLIHDGSSP